MRLMYLFLCILFVPIRWTSQAKIDPSIHVYAVKSLESCLDTIQASDPTLILSTLQDVFTCNSKKWNFCLQTHTFKNIARYLSANYPCGTSIFLIQHETHFRYEILVEKHFQVNGTFLALHLSHADSECAHHNLTVVSMIQTKCEC